MTGERRGMLLLTGLTGLTGLTARLVPTDVFPRLDNPGSRTESLWLKAMSAGGGLAMTMLSIQPDQIVDT